MGQYCILKKCKNNEKKDKKNETKHGYHRVPSIVYDQGEEIENTTTDRQNKWRLFINNDDVDVTQCNIRVCSDHFINSEYLFGIV